MTSGTHADFALRVTHEGLADAPLANDAGHAIYRDVAASTDLLVSAGDTQAEWFYVLRDARAKATFATRMDLGSGLTKVATRRDGSLAFQDARGLAFPVVVDPAIALPFWEEVSSGNSSGPPVRTQAAMACDSTRGTSVLFGGCCNAVSAASSSPRTTNFPAIPPARTSRPRGAGGECRSS